jgi:hypothetical protein
MLTQKSTGSPENLTTVSSKGMKAEIAQVPIGNRSIEGLMAEDGIFGIAMPQLVSHDLAPPNRSLKQLNKLYSTAFQSHQWRTTLNPKAVNVILLPDFEQLLRKLDKTGNKAAEQLVDDLVGLLTAPTTAINHLTRPNPIAHRPQQLRQPRPAQGIL